MSAIRTLILGLLLALFALPLSAVELADPPDCSAVSAADGGNRLGLVSPSRNPDLEVRLWELGLYYDDLVVCREPWERVLPSLVPWAPVPALERWYGWAVFGAALVLVLLSTTLAPRAWRRQATLLGLLGIAGGTWALGVGGLALANSLGLPQKYLYDEVVLFQPAEDEARWLRVSGVWELDRALMAQGLKPDMNLPALKVEARPGEALVLSQEPGGEPLAPPPAGSGLELAGPQQWVGDVPWVQVMVVQVPTEGAEPAATNAVSKADVPAEEPVTGEPPVVVVNPGPEPVAEEAPETLWVPRNDIVSIEPAILDPVDKTFRVHRPLNIRESAGVQHPRLPESPLRRGARVKVLATYGDWWKVEVEDSGSEGWVNSLWLRGVTE